MPKLKDLLKGHKDVLLKGSSNPQVTGITSHSKTIKPGELYAAFTGLKFDGRDFIDEALRSGASGVITDIYNPLLDKKVAQIITKNPKKLAIDLSLKLYESLENLIACTGTNGKTTVTFCIKQLLEALSKPCALVGTCLIDTLKSQTQAHLTTPDGITLARLIHEAKAFGASAMALEVSSHALDQQRVLGHTFKVATFTNLTHDHLDYHKTFDEYASAKLKLFTQDYKTQDKGFCVLNLDDPFSSKIAESTQREVLSYSLKDPKADLFLDEIKLDPKGFSGRLHFKGTSYLIRSSLVGLYNASNLLAALLSCYCLYPDMEKLTSVIDQVRGAPGRLERVKDNIFIDYAHTPDGLLNLLKAAGQLGFDKIRLVFGCGGDRDKQKRPQMAKIAAAYADEIILTSDNPRSEDPSSILGDIIAGFEKGSCFEAIVDRKQALIKALSDLDNKTLLLVVGKGHEKVQHIGHQTLHFDEKEILEEALKR